MRNSPVRVAENLYREKKSGIYWGRKKVNGKRRWECLDTDNRERAKSKLRAWLLSLESLDASAATFKLGALADLYEQSKRGLKESQWPFILKVFRETFPTGMNMRVDQLRHSQLVAWITGQAIRREWSPRTFNAYRLMLRDMFAIAEADGIVSTMTNPFKAHLLKPRKLGTIVRHRPTKEQFYSIIDDVRTHGRVTKYGEHSADFLQFLGEAGVGQAEAAGLLWEHVDDDQIQITRQKTGERFTIPVYVWLRPLVEKLRKNSVPDYRLAPKSHVFHVRDAKRALDAACKRLGLRHYSQRNLRQFCIARLAAQGVDARQISLWQGHRDGGVLIQRVYRNCFSDDDKAIERRNLAKLSAAA